MRTGTTFESMHGVLHATPNRLATDSRIENSDAEQARLKHPASDAVKKRGKDKPTHFAAVLKRVASSPLIIKLSSKVAGCGKVGRSETAIGSGQTLV
jgi:hypothetical protein